MKNNRFNCLDEDKKSSGGGSRFTRTAVTYEDVAAGKGEECGKPGINGGDFSDPKMKFGVNCYGVKPEPDENNIEKIINSIMRG